MIYTRRGAVRPRRLWLVMGGAVDAPFQRGSLHVRILASIVCVIAACVPVWWMLTAIERLPLPAEEVRALETRGACPIRTAWAVVVPTDECENVLQELQRHSMCVDWRVEGPRCVAGAPSATSTYRLPDTNVSAHLAPLLHRADSDSVVVPYARKIRLVFSLLQEDASVGRALQGWDLTHALHNTSAYEALAPLARTLRALERVYDIQLESQVQWYAPLELEPQHRVAGNDSFYTVSMQDARVFVNAEQWRLDSYGTADLSPATEVRTLQFVLYVPSVHAPLYLDAGTLHKQPAWLLPQWGGVVVWNGAHHGGHLSLDALQEPVSRFAEQMRALLGLERARSSAMADDGLVWRRTLEMARSAVETLGSIVRLVTKIPNLGVNTQVRDATLAAIESLSACDPQHADAALHHATQAHTHASRAFYDPSMLATLYFPSEHNFAVYTPLFGPLFMPLGLGWLREWRRRRLQPR